MARISGVEGIGGDLVFALWGQVSLFRDIIIYGIRNFTRYCLGPE
jgi:hypothetical protein